MVNGKIPVASKRAWSKLIWDRAWKLEDANWQASNLILKDNDLLINTMGETKYITWWSISDMDYRLMSMCEDMSKLVCHASRLKRDDVRLKSLTMSYRTCTNCELYCIEDIVHIVSQCPFYQDDRANMYKEIFERCPNVKVVSDSGSSNFVYYLLGKQIPSICDEEMLIFWCLSGNAISRMYRKALSSRTWVG